PLADFEGIEAVTNPPISAGHCLVLSGWLSLIVLAAGFRNVLRHMPVRLRDRTKRGRISIISRRVIGARPAATRQPIAVPRWSGTFLVEDIECRQADVRDFLLAERDFVTH